MPKTSIIRCENCGVVLTSIIVCWNCGSFKEVEKYKSCVSNVKGKDVLPAGENKLVDLRYII